MPSRSKSQALREIRTLYTLGPSGGLTDAQLVERFLKAEGPDREDAFAALVHRHGPMVLQVCRRMLGGAADTEDAFQAVFLVLARKAGAVLRLEGLKPWLYGVAVRTAKEARRRSARQGAREGAPMEESCMASPSEEGQLDLLTLLDEEINRLPARLREALILCEFEGLSRQDAARQLGLPEGTLSSRLSRGRSLLRDRLTRRGIALGAGGLAALSTASASAALSGPLAETTVRLSLKFSAGGIAAGSVPGAVASLAEGVLAMIRVTRLKLVLNMVAALGAAGFLAGGLAWAVASGPEPDVPVAKAKAPPAVAKDEEKAAVPRSHQIRGVIVDEAGRPVEGAVVLLDAFRGTETRSTTGPDGSFVIANPSNRVEGRTLQARSADKKQLGTFRYGYQLSRADIEAPARIVLKPAREIVVSVTDEKKAAVPGAVVEAVEYSSVFAEATTDAAGVARLLLSVDDGVMWIFSLKSGKGFDYAEFGEIDEAGRTQKAVKGADLPASVALTLDGARTARIKAVGADDKPLAGVTFAPWTLRKKGRRSELNASSRIKEVVTDSDGVATFDWLPAMPPQPITFWPRSEGFAHRRVQLPIGETKTVVARLVRTGSIQGRVVFPDGSPAAGLEVHAYGTGQEMDHGQAQTRSGTDGTYSMNVSPDEAYAVYIDDKDWAAPSRLDVVVRDGQMVEAVDFHLTRGTLLHGKVTIAPDDRPAVGVFMRLDETGERTPDDLRRKGDTVSRQANRQWGPYTDASGHYEVRVGPGIYTLFGPPHFEHQKLKIGDEAEVVRDYQMPRPEKGKLSGRVVLTGAEKTGVAGAQVEVVACLFTGAPFIVTADAEGRFELERELVRSFLGVKSPDGRLGTIVEIEGDTSEIVIPVAPTATATGLLLDEQGKPAANLQLSWGRKVPVTKEENGPHMTCFGTKVVTDAEGRFTLPSLVIGQEYNISVQRGNGFPATGKVRPEAPGSIDLGTLKIGGYRPKPGTREFEERYSSFNKDAPGAGKVAPSFEATTLDGKPLTLGDFQGKYVLLDFWATWCGPCIAEFPQLQSVHEAFGQDPRFAILSLSVDEKIEEPKAFQEKRKLPWSQAFLGVGIDGPIPGTFGVRAIPAFVLVGPDGKIVARGMRGEEIKKEVARALGTRP